ncbi:MAG: alpha-L-fucosidase, partial [Bacteroidetes bacterium]
MKQLLFVSLIGVLFFSGCSESKPIDYAKNETAEQKAKRMQWWKDAKFGMFIHWGGYAQLGGVYKGDTINGIAEWIQFYKKIPAEEYATAIKPFNPIKYNPEQWAKLARNAGMKYLVITSKHHEGLAMWDSKVTDFDIVDFTTYGKDVLKPLSEACKKNDVKFCTYHSILDWHYAEAKGDSFPLYRDKILKPQLKEILEELDPKVMWFDGEWIPEWTEEQGVELYNYLRNMKPDLIINNRVGKGRDGMQGMNKEGAYVGDFGTPEQEILSNASKLDWESCMTMNDTWGFKHGDSNWKSSKTLIYNLIDVVSKGGNYLLNVGPTSEGLIPQESIDRLTEIGKWLKINGEAIYGTIRAEHYKEGQIIRYTASKDNNTVYAISLEWPGKTFSIKNYEPEENSKIYLLGYAKPLSWDYNLSNGLIIDIPDELQLSENWPCQYAFVFKIVGQANELAA